MWCGREPWPADLTAEHLLPRSRRGRTVAENLAVACRLCNKRRRTKPVVAYVRAQRQDGYVPRVDLLETALVRLSAPDPPPTPSTPSASWSCSAVSDRRT